MRIVRARIRHSKHGLGRVLKAGVCKDTYVVQFDKDIQGHARTVHKRNFQVATENQDAIYQ